MREPPNFIRQGGYMNFGSWQFVVAGHISEQVIVSGAMRNGAEIHDFDHRHSPSYAFTP
jgi:hypothetical protein